jgi:serine protease inhibitor
MNAKGIATRPSPRSRRLACIVLVVLVAGCGQTPTSASPSAAAIASPTPTPTGTLAATPTPTPGPSAPGGLIPGSVAVTVSDRLLVRSKPRVSDDSVMYEPVLPIGSELLVLGGPVVASGYTWFHVAPTSVALNGGVSDGWVAMAARDGTPWIALSGAPLAGLELAQADVARAPASPAAAKQAAASINAFGLNLYRRLLGDAIGAGENAVVSPTSIALALAMARAGARRQTASQMDTVLHTTGWDALGGGLNSLDQSLASRNATWKDEEGKTHALALKVANEAFAQRGWPIEQPYLDAIAKAFGAGLGLVDYQTAVDAARKTINDWVSRQTAKRIPELLSPQDLTDLTRLVLVNAIYLKANWLREFEPDATKSKPFTRPDGSTVKVPTMTLVGEQDIPLAQGTGWQATELQYAGKSGPYGAVSSSLAMTLILPDNLAKFEKGLNAATLRSVTAALASERKRLAKVTYAGTDDCGTYAYALQLSMPRFSAETRALLVPVLRQLGMTDAVDASTADFTGITSADPPIYISQVIHEANIDVDEKGTEAAAATAVVMAAGGCTGPGPAKIRTLKLDKPFLFLIRDLESGAILFMGRVVDPSLTR